MRSQVDVRSIEARPSTGLERTRSPSSPGRIVVQAWLASRGLILAVALVLAGAIEARPSTGRWSHPDCVGFFLFQLVPSWSRLRPVRAAMAQSSDQISVEPRDGLKGNLLRANRGAFADVGAAPESLVIVLRHAGIRSRSNASTIGPSDVI